MSGPGLRLHLKTNTVIHVIQMKQTTAGWLFGVGLAVTSLTGWAGANPSVPFYGGGTITATPSSPIVGENTHIDVVVGNNGDQPATNVRVKVSFNDWGVTFNGWQEIATVTLASIPAGGTATASVDHVFTSRTHTCLEALVIGADANTDLTDDRGQINLEVINAGETFSYGVPIRNEGDVALHIAVHGKCAGRDAAGGAIDLCKPLDAQIDVAPGTEVIVPVVLDLRGIAPGAAVDYVVDAVDQFGNRNHVVLRVVRTSARTLVTEALAIADDLSDEMPTRALRQRIGNVSRHLDLALKPRGWIDNDHVVPNGGQQVLAQAANAARHAMELLAARVPLAGKVKLDALVRKLVDAERIIAGAAKPAPANARHGDDDDEDDDGDDHTPKDWMGAGDEAREQGHYVRAIEAYRRAWHQTTH